MAFLGRAGRLALLLALAVPRLGLGAGSVPPSASTPEPAGKTPFQRAADALPAGDFQAAIAAAESAVAARPDDAAALGLLAALYEVASDARAEELRRRAGPAAKLPPPAPVALKAGADAWVVAPLVTVRRRPSLDAAAVGWLPAGANVRVARVAGDFAAFKQRRVERGKRALLELGLNGTIDGPSEELFVHRGLLSPKPVGAGDLVTRANALEKAGKRLEALRWLAMATELGAGDAARERTVRLALELGHPAIAAKAAAPPPRLRERWRGITAEKLEVLYRCRGDRAKATVIRNLNADTALDALGPDVCVADLDTNEPCPPLPPDHAYSDVQMAETPEQAEGAREAYPLAVEAHEKEVAAFREWMARVEEAFPDGPFLHVVLANDTDGYSPPLYRVQVIPPPPTCEVAEPERYGDAAFLHIPPAPPRATLDLWIDLDRYEGIDELLSLSASPDDALGRVHTAGDPLCEPLCM